MAYHVSTHTSVRAHQPPVWRCSVAHDSAGPCTLPSASNALTGEGIEEGVSWLAENVVKASKASKKSKK